MGQPGFSVCAMVREKPDVIDRFARHYLRLGAETVRIFFDGETDEAVVPDLPGIELTVCDRTFWEAHLGRQPAGFQEGHLAILRVAHESARSEWQFICDADEFLVSDVPVADILSRVPAGCEALRVLNAEAAWGPGDRMGAPFGCSHFRLVLSPRKEKLLRLLMPIRRWDFFGQGFAGHRKGKHFLRKGTVVDTFNSHHSRRGDRILGVWAHDLGFALDRVFVAHFDAISEARWTEKWRRRVSRERASQGHGANRVAQLNAFAAAASDDRALSELFRETYAISRYEATVLSLLGSLVRRDIFPSES